MSVLYIYIYIYKYIYLPVFLFYLILHNNRKMFSEYKLKTMLVNKYTTKHTL